jgi:PAS domain S-box-containing protein
MIKNSRNFILVALALLPVTAFGTIMLLLFSQEQQKSMETLLEQTATSTVSAIQHSITNDISVLQALANDHALSRGDYADFDDAARRVLETRPAWLRIVLSDRQRHMVNTGLAFGSPMRPVMDIASSEVVYATRKPTVSGVLVQPDRLPEPVYVVRVPVVSQGRVNHTLTAVVRAFSLHDVLLKQSIPQGGRIGVIDQARHFVARTTTSDPHDGDIGGKPSASILNSIEKSVKDLTRRTTMDGEDIYIVNADVPTVGWTVLVAVPPEMIESPVRRSLYAATGGGAAALLMTLTLAGWAMRATTRRQEAESQLKALQAEKALEQRFADVADHFPGAIFRRVRHPDGRIELPYISRMILPNDTAEGMPTTIEHLMEMVVPLDRQRWFDAIAVSERSLSPLNFEGTFQDSGGGTHWLRASANVRRGGDGSTIWDGVLLDITELKAAEARQQHSQSLLQLVLDHLPAGVFILNASGQILSANPAADRIWAVTSEIGIWREAVYRGWWAETGEPVQPRDWPGVQAALYGTTMLNQAVSIECFDGSRKVILVSGVPLRGSEGADCGAVAVIEDVTDEKRNEQALRDSERMLRLAQKTANAGAYEWDIQKNRSQWSADFARLIGKPEDVVPSFEVWVSVVHSDDRDDASRIVREVAQGKRDTFSMQYRIVHPDRGLRWLEGTGQLIRDAQGRPLRLVGFSMDITERKRAEQALQASRDEAQDARRAAERADLAKSKFLAAASHDLRQPVQSLFFLLGVLRGQVSDARAAKALTHAEEALNALNGLLDGLLDVSKLDAGLIAAKVSTVQLRPLLEQIEAESRLLAEAKKLNWYMECLDCAVETDSDLLARVIRNLVENAIRYTQTGTVSIRCRCSGDTIKIAVVDTGIGIPDDRIEDIFAEFVQIGNAERDRRRGLGLGLAIVRRLAHLLDHPVEVHSVVGSGSEFTITVPLAAAQSMAQKPQMLEPVPSAHAAGGWALVIDDDPMVLLALQTLLADWGWRVIAAPCLQTAVDRLNENDASPRLVLSDYRLGGDLTGVNVILALRERFSKPFTSVLLTGDTAAECRDVAAKHGITVLHKPVTPAALQSVLADVEKTTPGTIVPA